MSEEECDLCWIKVVQEALVSFGRGEAVKIPVCIFAGIQSTLAERRWGVWSALGDK